MARILFVDDHPIYRDGLRRALEEYVIEGMKTTIPLHQKLLKDPEFQNGDYTIKWLEEWLAKDEGAA